MERGSGRFAWTVSILLFAASVALAGWLIRAGRIDTDQLAGVSDWTPKHVMHDPDRFVTVCRQRLAATGDAIRSAVAQLQVARESTIALAAEIEARSRLARQRRIELKAVYGYAESSGRWPVRYGSADMDRRGIQAILVGTSRYVQELNQVSAHAPRTLAEIDRRLRSLEAMSDTADQIRGQIDALPPVAKPLGDEMLNRLIRVGQQVASLEVEAGQLGEPAALSLPRETPPINVDENELARAIAEPDGR